MDYSNAKKCLKFVPENGVVIDKEADKMSDPSQRLCFKGVYSGRLNWNGNLSRLIFYFRFSIELLDIEVPLYDTKINISRETDKSIMEARSKFLMGGEVYSLQALWTLDSPMDILIGLGFKSVSINVAKTSEQQKEIASGELFQTISLRLKSCLHTNVRTEQGWPGDLIKKYKMMSKFVTYEV